MAKKKPVKKRPFNPNATNVHEAVTHFCNRKKSYSLQQIEEIVSSRLPKPTLYDEMVRAQDELERLRHDTDQAKGELEYRLELQAKGERTLCSLAEQLKSQATAVLW